MCVIQELIVRVTHKKMMGVEVSGILFVELYRKKKEKKCNLDQFLETVVILLDDPQTTPSTQFSGRLGIETFHRKVCLSNEIKSLVQTCCAWNPEITSVSDLALYEKNGIELN